MVATVTMPKVVAIEKAKVMKKGEANALKHASEDTSEDCFRCGFEQH